MRTLSSYCTLRLSWLVVVIQGLLMVSCTQAVQWESVASDRKEDGSNGSDYGYRIERRLGGRASFRVTIDSDRMQLRIEAPAFQLLRVAEQKWFCDDRVLYLHLAAEYRDSGVPTDGTTKIAYDFERGELASYSPSHTWTIWAKTSVRPRTLTEADFQARLERMRTGCAVI